VPDYILKCNKLVNQYNKELGIARKQPAGKRYSPVEFQYPRNDKSRQSAN
jgi:hypothetical protein